jgi:hypothetical protein
LHQKKKQLKAAASTDKRISTLEVELTRKDQELELNDKEIAATLGSKMRKLP